MKEIVGQIATQEGFEVLKISSLAGGSINEVFLLETSNGKMVLKINEASRFPGMFKAEKEGLEELGKAQALVVPEALSLGAVNDHAYLLLEYVAEGPENEDFRRNFAKGLAALHKKTSPTFGFHDANYIGSLPQPNEKRDSAADFYIEQRLEPQLRIAADKGFIFKDQDLIYKNISAEIPDQRPSLIHGDLWNGNYMATSDHGACLIDPAVSYGPREMDLSMMKLFGGFHREIYSIYQELFPLEAGFEERVPLWQLYYLLVHLNIFGGSYLPSVENIMKKYS